MAEVAGDRYTVLMKLISLNVWGGIAGGEQLLGFFNSYKETDIFCLQEMFNGGEKEKIEMDEKMNGKIYDLLSKLQNTLGESHIDYFHPYLGDWYGLAALINKQFEVTEDGDVFVHGERGYIPKDNIGFHSKNIQYVTFKTEKGLRTIVNFHGLWTGKGKKDTPARLLQSDNILNFLKKIENPYVICGDFNLLPETESLKKFEKAGLRNLISEYGITSTRTKYYTRPELYADYVFVSEGIKVNDFKVLPEEVSDHNALYLDFE